jgi:hypothetical protein
MLGVDHPVLGVQRSHEPVLCGALRQRWGGAGQLEPPLREPGAQHLEELAAEHARERLGGEQEAAPR